MAELRYPRFNAIYSNRDEAIKKLNGLTRSYGEPVAIRYYSSENKTCVILAIFKSEGKGDYEISYDSNTELLPNVYTIEKDNSDKTDLEYIDIALKGKQPIERDIVIIESMNNVVVSYIFTNNNWQILSTSGSGSATIDKIYGGTF